MESRRRRGLPNLLNFMRWCLSTCARSAEKASWILRTDRKCGVERGARSPTDVRLALCSATSAITTQNQLLQRAVRGRERHPSVAGGEARRMRGSDSDSYDSDSTGSSRHSGSSSDATSDTDDEGAALAGSEVSMSCPSCEEWSSLSALCAGASCIFQQARPHPRRHLPPLSAYTRRVSRCGKAVERIGDRGDVGGKWRWKRGGDGHGRNEHSG